MFNICHLAVFLSNYFEDIGCILSSILMPIFAINFNFQIVKNKFVCSFYLIILFKLLIQNNLVISIFDLLFSSRISFESSIPHYFYLIPFLFIHYSPYIVDPSKFSN